MRYTTKEVAKILGVTDRTVRRYIDALITRDNNSYSISEKMLELLKSEHDGQATDKLRTSDGQYDRTEFYTETEYQEVYKRLAEYPLLKENIAFLKEQLEYHKKAGSDLRGQISKLINSIEQRNFIEAKAKGLDE